MTAPDGAAPGQAAPMSPEQAAYEEWKRHFDANLLEDWDEDLADTERDGWFDVAQAAVNAHSACQDSGVFGHVSGTRAQRAAAPGQAALSSGQADALGRAVHVAMHRSRTAREGDNCDYIAWHELDESQREDIIAGAHAAIAAAAAAQPANGGCPCCTGLYSDDCSCREDCGVTQCQAADPDYPDVSGGGVPYAPAAPAAAPPDRPRFNWPQHAAAVTALRQIAALPPASSRSAGPIAKRTLENIEDNPEPAVPAAAPGDLPKGHFERLQAIAVIDNLRSQLRETRAALSMLLDRTEGSDVLTDDERDDYRRGIMPADEQPAPGGDLVRQMAALADEFDRTASQCREAMRDDPDEESTARKAARAAAYRACAVAVRHGLRAAAEQPAPAAAPESAGAERTENQGPPS